MASDQLVTSRMVLEAVTDMRRIGPQRTWEHLEQVEPDLSADAMETLSVVHAGLLSLGGRAKPTARALREVEALVLVCVTALRRAGYEHWRQSAAGTPLARLEASLDDPGPAHGSRWCASGRRACPGPVTAPAPGHSCWCDGSRISPRRVGPRSGTGGLTS